MLYTVINSHFVGGQLWLTVLPHHDIHVEQLRLDEDHQTTKDILAVTQLTWQELSRFPSQLEKQTIYIRIENDTEPDDKKTD